MAAHLICILYIATIIWLAHIVQYIIHNWLFSLIMRYISFRLAHMIRYPVMPLSCN